MVKSAPTLVHAPLDEYETGSPEPAVAATVTWVPTPAAEGACVPTEIVWFAGETVSAALPPLGSKLESPANDAPTPVGYEPALMPARLALLAVATPLASVVAVPAALPLSVNDTDLPGTGLPPDVSVALRFAVPPYVPDAGSTA